MRPFFAVALLAGTTGCHVTAMPRSGAVAPPHGLAFEAGIAIPAAHAWNRTGVASADGHTTGVEMPVDVHFGLRYPVLDHCEIAAHTVSILRWLGELRCGLVQERRGHPISVALSAAMGADIGTAIFRKAPLSDPDFVPNMRVGVDMSSTLGNFFTPMVGAYLSAGSEVRGALSGAAGDVGTPPSIVRNEVRLVFPVGLGLDLNRDDEGNVARLIFGVVPFFVTRGRLSTVVPDSGIAGTVGMEIVGTHMPK